MLRMLVNVPWCVTNQMIHNAEQPSVSQKGIKASLQLWQQFNQDVYEGTLSQGD